MPQYTQAPNPQQMAPNPQQMAPNPQQLAPNPQQLAPNPQQLAPNPQQMAPNPQQLAPNPQQMAPNPQQMAPNPQQMAPNPQQLAPNPQQLAPNPQQLAPNQQQQQMQNPPQAVPYQPNPALLQEANQNVANLAQALQGQGSGQNQTSPASEKSITLEQQVAQNVSHQLETQYRPLVKGSEDFLAKYYGSQPQPQSATTPAPGQPAAQNENTEPSFDQMKQAVMEAMLKHDQQKAQAKAQAMLNLGGGNS
ncbi:polyadenylate binding domain-containing protein [Endozoicomonas elysicola]|nr:hypothetical protein [Endozoicomonas elysicola]